MKRIRLAPLVLMFGACAYDDRVEGSDDTALFPAARVRIDLNRRDPPRPRDSDGSADAAGAVSAVDRPAAFRAALEASVGASAGDLDFAIPSGASGDYRLREVSVVARLGATATTWDVAGLVGFAFDRLDLNVVPRSGGPQRSSGEGFGGVLFGIEFGWQPVDVARVYGRVGQQLLMPLAAVQTAELGLDATIAEQVHAFVAYRGLWFDAEGYELFAGDTDVSLDLQGVALGVELRF